MLWHRVVVNSFETHLWCGRQKKKKVVYELSNHLLRLCISHTHTQKVMSSVPALNTVTDILLYQPCVNQRGELKCFFFFLPLIWNLGLSYMNMLMCTQAPHREESRWNMSLHVTWWHYGAHGAGWKWPGSTPMLIRRWHNKSQSIWLGEVYRRLLREIIHVRRSRSPQRQDSTFC